MKQIQYCRCKINLAGQNCHTVILDEYSPVTWPEVQILMQLHGEENVMDIAPVGIGEVWPTNEKNRLISKYGRRVVESCFPGRNFIMEYVMTADTDLPRYDEEGRLLGAFTQAPTSLAPPDPRPAPKEEPRPPPQDPPGKDQDDGDDGDEDDVASAKATPSILAPIFKPGRHKPQPAST